MSMILCVMCVRDFWNMYTVTYVTYVYLYRYIPIAHNTQKHTTFIKIQPWLVLVDLLPGIDGRNISLGKTIAILTSWWLNHPSEKYARQNGNLPQVGVKIKNTSNHHLANHSSLIGGFPSKSTIHLCRHTLVPCFLWVHHKTCWYEYLNQPIW